MLFRFLQLNVTGNTVENCSWSDTLVPNVSIMALSTHGNVQKSTSPWIDSLCCLCMCVSVSETDREKQHRMLYSFSDEVVLVCLSSFLCFVKSIRLEAVFWFSYFVFQKAFREARDGKKRVKSLYRVGLGTLDRRSGKIISPPPVNRLNYY